MASSKVTKKKAKKALGKPSPNGATEDQVDMAATIPQHIDDKGTKVEDEAGTGENDSLGG
jgi:hypothetical protein